ncbi:MAG: chloride channel protein [Pseudomonadota bacterium]
MRFLKILIIRLSRFAYLSVVGRTRPNLHKFWREKHIFIWFLALVVGIFAAYVAIIFRVLIGLTQDIWLGTTSERVFAAAQVLPSWMIFLGPVIGGILVGLLLQFVMPGKRALGVADVIEARAIKDCKMAPGAAIWSALISILSLGFGASAGREGPVVHLGAAIASKLEDLFQLPSSARRTLLACGVATAVSASFNAPIAGVLFAHEVILAHYALSAFVPIVISSVVGTILSRIYFGDAAAFIIPNYQITSHWEFPAFALLGLICAAVAIIFQFSLIYTDKVARNIHMPLWLRPVIGGVIVGGIAIFFPQILGVGYDTTDAALNQNLTIATLFALLVAKTAATAITLASRFGGGVFSPSLYLGAMTGGAFGLIATAVFPEVSSSHGVYAIVGMGAVSAAVIGAPISTTLIVFELTGGYEVTLALLLAVSIATALNQAINGMGFFHWQLKNRGHFLHESIDQQIAKRLKVHHFMTKFEPGEGQDKIKSLDPKTMIWLTSDHTLQQTLRAFDKNACHKIAVIKSTENFEIIGWAEHWAALAALNQALVDIQVEEHR